MCVKDKVDCCRLTEGAVQE